MGFPQTYPIDQIFPREIMFYSQGGIERVIADIIFVDGTGSSVINIESYSVSRVLDKKKKKNDSDINVH